MQLNRPVHMLAGMGVVAMCAGVAAGDIIYENGDPFGGPFGLIGFDVFAQQTVGVRFTPDADYRFDNAGAWIMSNDFGGVSGALVRVTLRTDDNDGTISIPSDVVLEELSFNVSTVGWDPVLEMVASQTHPLLREGRNYWLVLECDAPNNNPVWNWATGSTGFVANTTGGQTNWQAGGSGAVAATVIEGSPACYADCDDNGALNILDYICFGNMYAAQHVNADCDGDGTLNILDYICFGNAYAGGCS